MTRRSLRVWMFAFALLSALAVSVHAGAKPPDLPVDPNDTIPLLTPPSIPEIDETPEPARVEPLPEPMPGWPPITIEYSEGGNFVGGGGIAFEYPPSRTLTLYRCANGLVASIDPTPAPLSMIVYHPVRPRMPLSVQRTFDECLLIGAHPLLSLVPLPDSLREERHTQEVVEVPPMPPVFGVGVNSDAGLTGNLIIESKPEPQELDEFFRSGVVATGSGSIVITCNASCGSEQQRNQPEPIREMPQPQEGQVCPYHGPCDRHVEAIGDEDIAHSVMANLEKLIEAEQLYETACKMAESGHYADAMKCVAKASGLCSPSRFEDMKIEVVSHILSCVICGSGNNADAEESDEPPSECLPYWFGGEEVQSPNTPTTESHDVPQIMIQALVAQVDVSGKGFNLEETLQDAKSCGGLNDCLRTLKIDGCLDVLSHPQVQTLDKQTARVFVGQSFPIITGTTITNGFFASGPLDCSPTGIELVMTPSISCNGSLHMHVVATVSSKTINQDGQGGNTVTTNSQMVETTRVASDGETVVIVGPITLSDTKNECKVPYLSDLPLVGTAFHYRTQTKSKTQLLVILTPHIVRCKANADKILNQQCKQTQGCNGGCGMPCPAACKAPSYEDLMVAINPSCGMPCPAACKAPGVAEQVAGLMKACHLALGCGDYAKAAQLAREAHALDAERVAADPVVYKMHLLAECKDKGCCCCPDDCCCPEDGCCCGDAGCCCPAKVVVKGGCVIGGILVNMPAPTLPCPRVLMLPPSLPAVDATVIVELQKLLDEKWEAATAKPALEVVEEESEEHEVPKAVAKPFRVQAAPTGMVMSFDDVLKFLPGETWTEFDPKTNHVRALYRVRVGNAVYCVRYDGELSVDLSVTPSTGCGEKCEDK